MQQVSKFCIANKHAGSRSSRHARNINGRLFVVAALSLHCRRRIIDVAVTICFWNQVTGLAN